MYNVLLDENISHQYTTKLTELGYTVFHVSDLQSGTSDTHVLHLATVHNAILITQDSDFGDIIFRSNFDHVLPIIYLRDKSQDKRNMYQRLIKALASLHIDQKMFITINHLGVKISHR